MAKKGRPVGSTNKLSRSTFGYQQNFEKQMEGAPITRNSNRGWVNWGAKNDYPLKLSELYFNSIVHKSCVDFAVTAIVGDGVDYQRMNLQQTEVIPNYQQTWDEFLRCIALDYVLYGTYAFQIIRNRDGKTFSYYHQPISTVRCSERDEDGVITTYWICKDWTATGKYPPIELPRFGFQDDEEIKSGKPYLFVYETYTPDLEYYTSPTYVGGIKAIMTELDLIRYDLRAVKNNFSANGMLILPKMDTEEEQLEMMHRIKNSFIGSDNANSLVVTFSNGSEEDMGAARFVKIDKDSNNVNLFSETNERNIDRVIASHRIPNKALIGIPMDSSGFSNEGTLLETSYNLYNKTVATINRNAIIGTINKMFKMNGIDTELVLKPLTFIDKDATSNEETSTRDIHKIGYKVNETNVEEKVTNNEQY